MDAYSPGTAFLLFMHGSYYHTPENSGTGASSVDVGRPLRIDWAFVCL